MILMKMKGLVIKSVLSFSLSHSLKEKKKEVLPCQQTLAATRKKRGFWALSDIGQAIWAL